MIRAILVTLMLSGSVNAQCIIDGDVMICGTEIIPIVR